MTRRSLNAAEQLRPPLLTAVRLGEVIRLDRADVDDRHQLLRIPDSRFGKSRDVAHGTPDLSLRTREG